MVYLILCILASTGIFIVFKIIDQKKLASYPVIVINYLIAGILGLLIHPIKYSFTELLALPWIPVSVLIGFLFIVMFFVVAKSSSAAGISVTTVASKMSVVFPITFSLVLDPYDNLSITKLLAIMATIAGVFLTIYKPGILVRNKTALFIPLLLFAGMGSVDSLVKFAQFHYIREHDTAIFSVVLFAMAFLTGLAMLPFRKKGLSTFKKPEAWLWGFILGVVNLGSIYMLVSALNYTNQQGNQIDSSIIFGANNIGIVSLSVMTGLIFFKEKLLKINWVGISISIIAIILFTIS